MSEKNLGSTCLFILSSRSLVDFRNDFEESVFFFLPFVFSVMYYSSMLLMTFPLECAPFKK